MTWLDHHRRSEQYASEAQILAHKGEKVNAEHVYERAADAEVSALDALGADKPRTYGITAVSAVALYLKAAKWSDARLLAYRCLGSRLLREFARRQMEDLLDSIKMLEFGIDGNAQLLVSARGGTIVSGGAPWDVVLPQMQRVVSLFQRTTEYIKNVPHRKRGLPSKDIQDSYKPWIFQAEAGSYQFAVCLQQTRQLSLVDHDVSSEQVVGRLFDILDVCVTSPSERMSDVVPNDDYAKTFLKLTRDLAPTEKGSFSYLDIQAASTDHRLTLTSGVRFSIREALQNRQSPVPDAIAEDVRGVLRALHLNQDWIEVVTSKEGEGLRIVGAGDEVDDRIGPMVNQPVLVRVARAGEIRTFIDIELDE